MNADIEAGNDSGAVRLAAIRKLIDRAAADADRKGADVALVAVSKTFEAEAITPLLAAGHRVFGENRVQEARGKWPALKQQFAGVELGLIGPVQSNKALEAVEFFERIDSLDRPKLAAALADAVQKVGRQPRLLVQVNTGAEPQKAGVLPQDADAFLTRCRVEFELTIAGLMCLPPAAEPPSPHFALLAAIAARNGLRVLSMGMSADFAAAIQCGATEVRIGSALFGRR